MAGRRTRQAATSVRRAVAAAARVGPAGIPGTEGIGEDRPGAVSGADTPPNYSGAMRVYLGADHAGFELKNRIADHLRSQGHRSSTAERTPTTRSMTTPPSASPRPRGPSRTRAAWASCSAAAATASRSQRTRCPARAVALAWSVETAELARQHNNAQLIGIGGRMHTEAEALAIVDAFIATPWSEEPRHQRRIDILAEYERTGVDYAVPGAEDHTLHRLARRQQRLFGGHPVALSSPQGRFADSGRDARRLDFPPRPGVGQASGAGVPSAGFVPAYRASSTGARPPWDLRRLPWP